MGEQQKGKEVSGVASGDGMSPATSQASEPKAGNAGVNADKPKRRPAARTKSGSEVGAEPATPKRRRSAKAKNVLTSAPPSSDIRMEAGNGQSDSPRPDSHDLPPLPPAPVPTPEGIAFMQQHIAYQSALDQRTKLVRARLEQPPQVSKEKSPHSARQTDGATMQTDSSKGPKEGSPDNATSTEQAAPVSANTRQRKTRENSIVVGRNIQKVPTGEADLQAVKDQGDARMLRQLLDRSRALAVPAESTAARTQAVNAAQADVEAIRAIKDPVARKLSYAAIERNRQADAGYKIELDKLAPELKNVGEQAGIEPPATARSSGASMETPDGKAPAMSTAVPESVRKRFLEVDSDYYFPDRSPAFVDRGAKLATRGEHPEVVRALVEIAKERGWDSVTVKGSESFKRAAWMEASRNGMQVAGYKPTELELAQLKQREPNNSIEPGPVRDQAAARPVSLAKSTEQNERDRTLDAKLSAFAKDRPTLVVKKYPELVQAYALLDAARKFAEAYMPGHEEKFVAIGREMIIQQIRDGKEVVGPKLHPDQISQSRSRQQGSEAMSKNTQAKEIARER